MRAPQVAQIRSRSRSSIVISASQWPQAVALDGNGAPQEEQWSVTASRLRFASIASRSYTLPAMDERDRPTRGAPGLSRAAGALVAAVAFAGCERRDEIQKAADPPSFRPSVLVITLDTTRADALGCYGGPAWATPALDAIARRAVRFRMARAPAPLTLPAHATIFTGVYPFQHGVRDNGTFVLGESAWTLAERLKEAGWQTAAVPGALVVDSSYGLAQGFDRYFDLPQRDYSLTDEGHSRTASEVAAIATSYLQSLPADARFFLWVHFFDAHYPYEPPADLLAAHPFEAKGKRRDQRAAEQRHLYQLEVAAIDREVGKIVAALDRFGGAEEVVTIVVGDHGESLGQHGEATHSALVYDATLQVPLLIAHRSLPHGRLVEPSVSTVDVAPTILSLLGLPTDGTSGADLAPLWSDRPFEPSRPLYFENCATWFTSGWAPLFGVVEGRFKTIVGPQVRVFDVAADPDETKDVAADHPELVESARARLESFAAETLAAERRAPDAAELEALARLGYGQSEASSRREGRVVPGWQPKEALTPEQGLENTRRFTQANELWRKGEREKGIALLLELVASEPENAHYAEIAASLLSQLGRNAEALPLARRAAELAENVGNLSTLGACLLALGKKDEAFAQITYTVKRFPRLLPARYSLAMLLIERGRPGDAIEHLEYFLKVYEGGPEARAQAQALLDRARAAAKN